MDLCTIWHYRFSASTIVVDETTLAHEIRDHSVETATLVAQTFFSSAESAKVFRRLKNNILPQFHHNAIHGLVICSHVEKKRVSCL